MSDQNIKIGVEGDTSGAERMMDRLGDSGRKVEQTVAGIGKAADVASDGLERLVKLMDDAAAKGVDWKDEVRAAEANAAGGGGRADGRIGHDATPDHDAARRAGEAQRRAAEDQRQGRQREVEFAQRTLSQERGRAVSAADAGKALDAFGNLRSGRSALGPGLRRFDSYQDWWEGHRARYASDTAAASHRRSVVASVMQGTDDARDHGAPASAPPPGPDGPGEDAPGEGGQGGGRSGAFARKASSSALSFVKGGLALAGIGSVVSMLGKGISSATSENEAVDTLKRRMGDLGVNFDRLRESTRSAGEGMGYTFVESAKLAEQFAETAGRVKAGDDVGGSTRVSEGFARAYGMDAGQAVGFFGSARRMGATSDVAGDRRLALLIAESIGKSGYSGKADEIVGAISGLAEQNTRFSLQSPNMGAYATGLSSLMGGGNVPGMDPTGAAAALGRADSAFRGGGARGEASQNAILMSLMQGGMSPFAAKALQEGGLFATTESTFGAKGPFAGGFKGKLDDTTNLDRFREMFKRQYAGQDPLLAVNGFSNAFGLSMAQGQALMNMDDRPGGEMANLMKRNNLTSDKLNPSSLASIAQISAAGGDNDKLKGVFDDLMSRHNVVSADKKGLTDALRGGDREKLRDVMTQVAARSGQADDPATATRESAKGLEDVIDKMGSSLLLVLNPIRSAIVAVADKLTGGSYSRGERDAHGGKDGARYDYLTPELRNDKSGRLKAQLAADDKLIAETRKQAKGRPIDVAMTLRQNTDRAAENTRDADGRHSWEEARLQHQGIGVGDKAGAAPDSSGYVSDSEAWRHMGGGKAGGGGHGGQAGVNYVPHYTRAQIAAVDKQTFSASPYDALFKAAAARHGIRDWRILKRLGSMESHLNPNAMGDMTKHGRAVGMMQVMHGHRDVAANIEEAAALYRRNLDANGGDEYMAVKRYMGAGQAAEDYGSNFASGQGGSLLRGHFTSDPVNINLNLGGQPHSTTQVTLRPRMAPQASGAG